MALADFLAISNMLSKVIQLLHLLPWNSELVFRKEALNEHYWKTINLKFKSCLRHMTNSLICRDDLMKLKSLLLTFLFNLVLWTGFYQVTKEFLRITLSSVDNLTLNYHKWNELKIFILWYIIRCKRYCVPLVYEPEHL